MEETIVKSSFVLGTDLLKRYPKVTTTDSTTHLQKLLGRLGLDQVKQGWSEAFHKSKLLTCNLSSPYNRFENESAESLLAHLKRTLMDSECSNLAQIEQIEINYDKLQITFTHPKYSLYDVVTFSPTALHSSTKISFIIYQLLRTQHYLHSHGFLLGAITLKDILVDENFWVYIKPALSHHKIKPSTELTDQITGPAAVLDIDMTSQWVNGSISNYQYLMYLNEMSGRSMNRDDPNHHPILPWIMDFTSPFGGWRDLTKSKFRINKGDDQLDQTYEVAQKTLQLYADDLPFLKSATVPHHISDILSEITYYTYKARRTDKKILCQHVRQKWVPHEYPSSLRRLQEWTPDECIPEFFTDPSIFESIHDDLLDLEIPAWAESSSDFINTHMEALESENVSQNLHHWIDLTFGVKLSGQEAVEAKNVCLQLVDGHTHFTDKGLVQLFTEKHPEKIIPTKYQSARAPNIHVRKYVAQPIDVAEADPFSEYERLVDQINELNTARIELPADFNPLELLERVEKDLDSFTNTKPHTCGCDFDPYNDDMVYLGCLITQLILPVKTRLIVYDGNLNKFVNKHKELINNYKHHLPVLFVTILDQIFKLSDDFKHLSNMKPGYLLSSFMIPLPRYFCELYNLIILHKQTDSELTSPDCNIDKTVKHRISVYLEFIDQHGQNMSHGDLELFLPYIGQLMLDNQDDNRVQAVWYLFGQLSQLLGVDESCRQLSPLIVKIYQLGNISDGKRIKLYHRTFIQQLITQLGLHHFLTLILPELIKDLITCGEGSINSADDSCDLSIVIRQTMGWLASRIGPVLTAKYLTDRILQLLYCSYREPNSLNLLLRSQEIDELITKEVIGDLLITPAVQTLEDIVFLYGEQFILLQYLPYISHVVASCETGGLATLPESSSYKLLSCSTLLLHVISCLNDGSLLDNIETKLVADILIPYVAVLSSPLYTFQTESSDSVGTQIRTLLAFRLLDVIIVISQRIGFDQTRRYLKRLLTAFFKCFEFVHQEDSCWVQPSAMSRNDSNDFLDIKQSGINSNDFYVGTPVHADLSPPSHNISGCVYQSEVAEEIMTELRAVFSAELAHKSYIQCCRLTGGHYISDITNDDLIRQLCSQHEDKITQDRELKEAARSKDESNDTTEELFGSKNTNWFVPIIPGDLEDTLNLSASPSSVNVIGNKLTYIPQNTTESTYVPESKRERLSTDLYNKPISIDKLKRPEVDIKSARHLKSDWIAYWEHELGAREKGNNFSFNQIHLQSYVGHTGSVRYIHVLDNENSFITAGKDKTVRLFSLRNAGGGISRCSAQSIYYEHKKPVFYCSFLNSTKKIVSCDGTVHIWDPFTPRAPQIYESSRSGYACTAVEISNNGSPVIIVATAESTIRFIDIRQRRYAQEFRTAVSPFASSSIRSLVVGDTWISMSHSLGVLSTLDIRTGFHLAAWNAGKNEEVNQMKIYGSKRFLTQSDSCISLWDNDHSPAIAQAKSNNEQNICLNVYEDSLISLTSSNKIISYKPNIDEGIISVTSSDKLRADIFKSSASCLGLIPLNRQTLLSADNGVVYLYA